MVIADPQVSLGGVLEKEPVLDDERLVQPQGAAHLFDVPGRRILRHEQSQGVAGDVEDDEDDPGDDQQD